MVEPAPLQIHPFLAERFAEAVVPAAMVLVVDHDRRPLGRLLGRLESSDRAWLGVASARAALDEAAAAVDRLPQGIPPEELIAAHPIGKDAHTGRDIVADPPDWAAALNKVARALCVCTRKTSGWNPHVLAITDEGETLDKFVAAARELSPDALAWYSKLAAGLLAWMQGGELRGYLTTAEVGLLKAALGADDAKMFRWKERGGDFHRRKVQAFCYLAQKHNVGLAAVQPRE